MTLLCSEIVPILPVLKDKGIPYLRMILVCPEIVETKYLIVITFLYVCNYFDPFIHVISLKRIYIATLLL